VVGGGSLKAFALSVRASGDFGRRLECLLAFCVECPELTGAKFLEGSKLKKARQDVTTMVVHAAGLRSRGTGTGATRLKSNDKRSVAAGGGGGGGGGGGAGGGAVASRRPVRLDLLGTSRRSRLTPHLDFAKQNLPLFMTNMWVKTCPPLLRTL